MNKPFEQATNLAFFAACVLVGANAALQLRDRYIPRPSSSITASERAPTLPPELQIGSEVPALPGINFAFAEQARTVLVMVRSTCSYCTESMPFYKRLMERRRASAGTRVVAVSAEPETVTTAYLASHGVSVDQVVSLRDNLLRVPGTPTVIVVRADGQVTSSHVGKLNAAGEEDVLAQITQGGVE